MVANVPIHRFYRGQDNTKNENLILNKFRVMATSTLPLMEKIQKKNQLMTWMKVG
jgi:hypothetical protein